MHLLVLPAHAGFPSPAADWIERPLNLHALLVPHETSTYFAYVTGHSMLGVGIHDGDLLVVDRAIDPQHDHIVVVALDGGFLVKRLQILGHSILLTAEHPDYPALDVTTRTDYQFFGVVTYVVHPLAAPFHHALVRPAP